MFGNFAYFIIALLIYATWQPAEISGFTPFETGIIFPVLALLFVIVTRLSFSRLESRMQTEPFARLDHWFNRLLTRQSIMALILFAIDIYGLNLTGFTGRIRIFKSLPTLEAVVFISLFTAYLVIVWYCAHEVYRKLYGSRMSRRAYILSHISFAIPVLLPWLILSVTADIINHLPFDGLRQILQSFAGEAFFYLLFLVIFTVFGPALIQWSWNCTPLEPGPARSRIEALCRRAGVAYTDILCWPIFEGRMITAAVMGLTKWFRYILVTEALLDTLSPEEVDAVIAHEIGHVQRRHLHFYLFFFMGYLFFSFATFSLLSLAVLYAEPLYSFLPGPAMSSSAVSSILFVLIHIFTFLLYFRYIFGYFMRNFERQADGYVYSLFSNARPLISTFEKITLATGQPPDKPNWHHFSVLERVQHLLRCENDRSCLSRHDRKVRRAIALYLGGFILFCIAGYALNFGEAGQRLNVSVLEWQVSGNTGDPQAYRVLGDIYYGKKEFEKAIPVYEQAVARAPDDPETLNNLAWFYATCEKESLRNPARALVLAIRAAEFSQEAHILDTLAECYYVNGRFDLAVATGEKALARSKDSRVDYDYGKQLEKFRKALAASQNNAT